VDVIYDNDHSDSAESFIPGKTCKTLTARVACCQDKNGQFLDGYWFTYLKGWKPSLKQGFRKNCQELNDKLLKSNAK
jgi:hypothetical protein